jgi:hypothetical protein
MAIRTAHAAKWRKSDRYLRPVELILQEMAIELGSHSETMEKARAAAEEVLSRIRLGLI